MLKLIRLADSPSVLPDADLALPCRVEYRETFSTDGSVEVKFTGESGSYTVTTDKDHQLMRFRPSSTRAPMDVVECGLGDAIRSDPKAVQEWSWLLRDKYRFHDRIASSKQRLCPASAGGQTVSGVGPSATP